MVQIDSIAIDKIIGGKVKDKDGNVIMDLDGDKLISANMSVITEVSNVPDEYYYASLNNFDGII